MFTFNLRLGSNVPTLTSNWVSRLFWFGHAGGGIEKNAQQIFFKEAKTAAFQLRSPPAVEANALFPVGLAFMMQPAIK